MGIITGLLVASGHLATFEVPLWVILVSHAAIAFGTMFGGWRIVKTMGSKITKLHPSADSAPRPREPLRSSARPSSGIPVSTTHTITGAIVGVGATNGSPPSSGVSREDRLGLGVDDPAGRRDVGGQLFRAAPLLLVAGLG